MPVIKSWSSSGAYHCLCILSLNISWFVKNTHSQVLVHIALASSSSLLLLQLLGDRHGGCDLVDRRLAAGRRGLLELREDDVGGLEGTLAAGGHDGRAGPGTASAGGDRCPDLVLHRLDAEVEARVEGKVFEVVSG